MAEFRRKPNAFEVILLAIGIILIVIGYIAVHRLVVIEGVVSWGFLQTIFLWLIMILMVILTAVNENTKEELKTVIQNQVEEIRLLRNDLRIRR